MFLDQQTWELSHLPVFAAFSPERPQGIDRSRAWGCFRDPAGEDTDMDVLTGKARIAPNTAQH